MVDFSSRLKSTPAMAPDTYHAGNNILQQDAASTQHLHHSFHETIAPGGNSARRGGFCNSRRHALLWIARTCRCTLLHVPQLSYSGFYMHTEYMTWSYPIGSLLFASRLFVSATASRSCALNPKPCPDAASQEKGPRQAR